MRRKSERFNKKVKTSPEEKVTKLKRRTSTRKKQSSSSENESAGEQSTVQGTEPIEPVEKKSPVKQPVLKEESPEEIQDQVWQVKTAESSGDTGEIQKLKICLARPCLTPERNEKSPRSKRKHSRTSSSSNTTVEADDKKKGKHKSKRAVKESKEDCEKNQDSQSDEPEREIGDGIQDGKDEVEQTVETTTTGDDVPMSTTSEEPVQQEETSNVERHSESQEDNMEPEEANECEKTDADTTVSSQTETNATLEKTTSDHERSPSVERNDNVKSSVVMLKNSEEKTSSIENIEIDEKTSQEEVEQQQPVEAKLNDSESVTEDKSAHVDVQDEVNTAVNTEVTADKSPNERNRLLSTDSNKDKDTEDTQETHRQKDYTRTDFTQSKDSIQNGQACPLVINRKRKWGSRPSKVTTQKSITISSDILKDIIPDVKPVEFNEVIEEKKNKREVDKVERPVLPKIVIDNTEHVDYKKKENLSDKKEPVHNTNVKESSSVSARKISIVKDTDSVLARPPSPPRHKSSCILFISNLVRPFTLPQLKNLLQRTGRIVEDGFWIDKIKSKCYVIYESEDQAVETRHALHGVTWPVSNPKTLIVDFSSKEAFDKAKNSELNNEAPVSAIPGTVEDWLREQDLKRERGELEKPWERKNLVREWDVGKGDKDKEHGKRDERPSDKRRHHVPDLSPEPAKKFKKKEEEAPAKLLDDLFRKTKTTPCIYWLPLSAETIAIKEEQRRLHMAEHERRMQEIRRHRRH